MERIEATKKESTAFTKFTRGCRCVPTLYTYSRSLMRFMEFMESEARVRNGRYDDLLELDSEGITDCLEDWAASLSAKGLRPTTVLGMLSGPELFFEMNRKHWHKKLVKRGIGVDNGVLAGMAPVTNEEVRTMLGSTKKLRSKALVHFLASTGVRPGAIDDPVIQMKHLVDMPDPNLPQLHPKWCYAIRIYDGSREGYWAFLTPEARKALDSYLNHRRACGEEFTAESPIFATVEGKIDHLKSDGARALIYWLIVHGGVKRNRVGRRFDKAVTYMFRKRFNTILKINKDINSNIAEKLMAHKRGLDGTYLQPTREECYREFVKAIPDLTIDPTERQRCKLEESRLRIEELEAKNKESINMKSKMESLLQRIEFLENNLICPKGLLPNSTK